MDFLVCHSRGGIEGYYVCMWIVGILYMGVFMYMYMFIVFTCESRCQYICVYMYVEARCQCLHFGHSPPYFIETGSLTESVAHQFD